MLLRVAVDCDNRLTVQPSEADFDYFDLSARFDLVCVDRVILVTKTPNGPLRCLDGVYECSGYGRALRRTLRTPLATFTVNAADFEVDGDYLRWPIPPDWALTWSKNAPLKRLEPIVRREFTRRCVSAAACGVDVREVTRRVPTWARGVLSAAEWLAIAEGRPFKRVDAGP